MHYSYNDYSGRRPKRRIPRSWALEFSGSRRIFGKKGRIFFNVFYVKMLDVMLTGSSAKPGIAKGALRERRGREWRGRTLLGKSLLRRVERKTH